MRGQCWKLLVLRLTEVGIVEAVLQETRVDQPNLPIVSTELVGFSDVYWDVGTGT